MNMIILIYSVSLWHTYYISFLLTRIDIYLYIYRCNFRILTRALSYAFEFYIYRIPDSSHIFSRTAQIVVVAVAVVKSVMEFIYLQFNKKTHVEEKGGKK